MGTPSRRGDGHADLSYVQAAAREIGAALEGFTVVVNKSTVPVGTGDEVERIIRQVNPRADFAVVSNPEFLREGSAIEDFKRPDRVVVGTEDERARAVMAELYRPLSLNASPVQYTARRTAELTKYAANAFLAMKITFINEIADLCEKLDADVQDVAHGIGMDRRIGSKFLHAGPGYGGSCFPQGHAGAPEDRRGRRRPHAADRDDRRHQRGTQARDGGQDRRRVRRFGRRPQDRDPRPHLQAQHRRHARGPSIAIIEALQKAGATVCAYDPVGMDQARAVMENVAFAGGIYEAAEGADAVAIVTEWNEFRSIDLRRLASLMAKPVMVDFRNVYRGDEVREAGFAYVGVGRPCRGKAGPEVRSSNSGRRG